MFATLKKQLTDARSLSALCKAAEAESRAKGIVEPGSEHFLLAALALPDRTAAIAFAHIGLTRGALEEAIESQYTRALRSVGVDVAMHGAGKDPAAPPSPPESPLYRAAPSGQALVQRLAASRGERASRPLLSADVLMAVAVEDFSVAARALRALGVEPEQLVDAAARCIADRRENR